MLLLRRSQRKFGDNKFNIYPEGYPIFLIKNDSRQNISNFLTDHTSAEKRTNKNR